MCVKHSRSLEHPWVPLAMLESREGGREGGMHSEGDRGRLQRMWVLVYL